MTTESGPRAKRAMALGLAVLLFGLGAAAGVAGDRWVIASQASGERRWWERRRPEAVTRNLREQLHLDETQARQVEEIMRRTWAATRQTFASVEPKVDDIRRRGDDEIRALLRADQRQRFEQLVAEQARRREAMRRGLDLPVREEGPR